MLPAFHIPLSAKQLRQIGELCAIQAQIEWSMQMVVRKLLGLSLPATLRVLGSNSIETNSSIWISTVREKISDDDAIAWADYAYARIKDLSQGRNDFIHGLYGVDLSGVIRDTPSRLFMVASRRKVSTFVKQAEPTGIRLRSHAETRLDQLPTLLKTAALVSVIAAYLDDVAAKGADQAALRSWRRRLGSRLPPEPPKVEAKKGKGRLGQPQSSPQ